MYSILPLGLTHESFTPQEPRPYPPSAPTEDSHPPSGSCMICRTLQHLNLTDDTMNIAQQNDILDSALDKDDYETAERACKILLDDDPQHHWYWARRSMCARYMGQKQKAIEYAQNALELMPTCSLALWELACSYESNQMWNDAIAIHSKIIKKGYDKLVNDDCSEGPSATRGLIADCWYYKSLCLLELRKFKKAEECYEQSMSLRRPGQPTVYPKPKAQQQYERIKRNLEAE
jgi:tetratricopeptide (TPR) repeat protein